MKKKSIIKPDCDKCLNSRGYGWDCDRQPLEFEPECELVRDPTDSFYVSDFSKIPKDRKIYCRNFIPEDNSNNEEINWTDCNYIDGKWYRR